MLMAELLKTVTAFVTNPLKYFKTCTNLFYLLINEALEDNSCQLENCLCYVYTL